MSERYIRATTDMDTMLIPVSSIKIVFYTMDFTPPNDKYDNQFEIRVGVGDPKPNSDLIYRNSLIIKSFRDYRHNGTSKAEEFMYKFKKFLNDETAQSIDDIEYP